MTGAEQKECAVCGEPGEAVFLEGERVCHYCARLEPSKIAAAIAERRAARKGGALRYIPCETHRRLEAELGDLIQSARGVNVSPDFPAARADGRVVKTDDYQAAVLNRTSECEHGRPLGVFCAKCNTYLISPKVERWLEGHPGARLIVTRESVELCARELRSELTTDTDRYVSRDNVGPAQREAALSELVDEMAIWEANGWEYEP